MFAEIADPPIAIAIGGGSAGLLAFVVAIYKVYSQDRVWKSLIREIRSELTDCREARETDREQMRLLEGEVTTLRREMHAVRWLGMDPASRPSPEGGPPL